MRSKSSPRLVPRAVQTEPDRLRDVADALGVPLEAFMTPEEPQVLHTDADGTRWLLLRDAQGVPVVRRGGGEAADPGAGDERVAAFLARAPGSPPGLALAALVDRLLAAHLAG